MKKFNEKHEAILDCYASPSGDTKNLKDGEISAHAVYVQNIAIMQISKWDDNGLHEFIKVNLSPDFILDIAKQIQEIQSEEILLPYSELPF